MAATMKDIARRTGLGLATISSYFNGGNVREKNRVKIEEAIQELHYEVNEVARGLKTNATKTIGVVIPELNNTFCAEIITEMEDVLRSHGYATIVCDCRTDKKLERDAVEFLSRKRVDGIISMPVDAEGNHLKKFQKMLFLRFQPASVFQQHTCQTNGVYTAVWCRCVPRYAFHRIAHCIAGQFFSHVHAQLQSLHLPVSHMSGTVNADHGLCRYTVGCLTR